jgi:TRAP-type C4-dicarboxylate transport system permease large subunit
VGLNLFVIKSIAPDIPLKDVILGVMPFVALMILSVVILCIFPGIATWFAMAVMGG